MEVELDELSDTIRAELSDSITVSDVKSVDIAYDTVSLLIKVELYPINNEPIKISVSVPDHYRDSNMQDVQTIVGNIQDQLREGLSSTYELSDGPAICLPYGDAYCECRMCGEKVSILDRQQVQLFEQTAEMSDIQPHKTSTQLINELDDEERHVLELYLLSLLRDECYHREYYTENFK